MKQTLQSHFLPSVSHLLTDGRIDPTSQKTFLADLHTSAVQAAISQLAPNPVLQSPPSPCREGGTFLSSFQPQTTPLCPSSTPDTAVFSTPTERGLARPKTRPVPPAAVLSTPPVTCSFFPLIPPPSGGGNFREGLPGWHISWQPCPFLLSLQFLISFPST